jgi:hypothetical protein
MQLFKYLPNNRCHFGCGSGPVAYFERGQKWHAFQQRALLPQLCDAIWRSLPIQRMPFVTLVLTTLLYCQLDDVTKITMLHCCCGCGFE